MARLFTPHDPFHIHKILGMLVLINYLYRFYLIFTRGTAFPPEEELWLSTVCTLLHGALSWSSLLLPLPARRNFNSPMIWPEFRLHSITFASRHVVTTILTLTNLWPTTTATKSSLSLGMAVIGRLIVIVGTIWIASVITNKYNKDRSKRTTNAMPYPEYVTPEQQLEVKAGYTRAQFSATKSCQLPDATMNFAPLLAIQMAPLLMTLVRKGKITSIVYHRVYAASLFVGYLAVFVRMIQEPELAIVSVLVMSLPTSNMRRYGMSAMWVGIVQVLFTTGLCPLILYHNPFFNVTDLLINQANQQLITQLAWIATLVTCARQMELYSPLMMIDNNNKNNKNMMHSTSKTTNTNTMFGGFSFSKGIGNFAEFVLPVAALVYRIISK